MDVDTDFSVASTDMCSTIIGSTTENGSAAPVTTSGIAVDLTTVDNGRVIAKKVSAVVDTTHGTGTAVDAIVSNGFAFVDVATGIGFAVNATIVNGSVGCGATVDNGNTVVEIIGVSVTTVGGNDLTFVDKTGIDSTAVDASIDNECAFVATTAGNGSGVVDVNKVTAIVDTTIDFDSTVVGNCFAVFDASIDLGSELVDGSVIAGTSICNDCAVGGDPDDNISAVVDITTENGSTIVGNDLAIVDTISGICSKVADATVDNGSAVVIITADTGSTIVGNGFAVVNSITCTGSAVVEVTVDIGCKIVDIMSVTGSAVGDATFDSDSVVVISTDNGSAVVESTIGICAVVDVTTTGTGSTFFDASMNNGFVMVDCISGAGTAVTEVYVDNGSLFT